MSDFDRARALFPMMSEVAITLNGPGIFGKILDVNPAGVIVLKDDSAICIPWHQIHRMDRSLPPRKVDEQ